MLAAITAADAAGFTCSEAPFWTWDMVGCGGMWWDMVGYGGIWIRIGADESKEFSFALGDMPPIYLYIVGGMVGWQDLHVWDWFIHSCR